MAYDNGYQKFAPAPQYRDVGFLILWILHLFVVFAFLIYGGIASMKDDDSKTKGGDDENIILTSDNAFPIFGTLAITAGIGLLFALVWLSIARAFPKQLIYVSVGFVCAWAFGIAFYLFAIGSLVGGIIFLFFAGLQAVLFWMWRNRIPFAATMLRTIVNLTRLYPATVAISIASMFAQLVWSIIWLLALILPLKLFPGLAWPVFIFMLLSYYWTSQVIKNVVHVTTAGTFSTWYFLSGPQMPTNPTAGAFKRATTWSLGSICFGSLLVAAIKTLRSIVRSFRNDHFGFLAYIVDCILSCFDWLLQYFNHYAFVSVAVYGMSYWEAAKNTFQLLERSGVAAIINDNIIGAVLTMGCIIGGFVCAVAGGIIAALWVEKDWLFVAIVAFFIGFSLLVQALEVIDSGVATIFVCFAEDPAALHRTDPVLYEKFVSTYGGVISLV